MLIKLLILKNVITMEHIYFFVKNLTLGMIMKSIVK